VSALVTVVIPAYGSPEPLRLLLAALDAQAAVTGEPLRVIVSDDASPEPLAGRLDLDGLGGLAARVVRSESNGGPGAARNRALEEVLTPWVAFIDADELPAPGWLTRLQALISAPDAADVLVGRVQMPASPGPFEHATEATGEEEQYVAGNVAFRTDLLRQDGGFDERFYDPARKLHFREDAELRFRLERASRRVSYEPELVVEHPPLPRSLSTPLRLARRYYFDPLLAREHPERFGAFVRKRRVGPYPLRKARHDSALVYATGLLLLGIGRLLGSRRVMWLGASSLGSGWLLSVLALSWRRRVAPGELPALAGVAALVPLVYLYHYYRGVIAFRHRPRL